MSSSMSLPYSFRSMRSRIAAAQEEEGAHSHSHRPSVFVHRCCLDPWEYKELLELEGSRNSHARASSSVKGRPLRPQSSAALRGGAGGAASVKASSQQAQHLLNSFEKKKKASSSSSSSSSFGTSARRFQQLAPNGRNSAMMQDHIANITQQILRKQNLEVNKRFGAPDEYKQWQNLYKEYVKEEQLKSKLQHKVNARGSRNAHAPPAAILKKQTDDSHASQPKGNKRVTIDVNAEPSDHQLHSSHIIHKLQAETTRPPLS
ncbi:MAG: hypothetical protein GY822_09310, partial [Deltaproteobacteria bacterium]|nr:hypothetical protein [Deltaproteobacteria bacterium]